MRRPQRLGYSRNQGLSSSHDYDERRGSATARGYDWRWRKARLAFLQNYPLCAMCQRLETPVVTAARVVDHIKPHRGDKQLFWDQSNWQSLCVSCHSSEKQKQEKA